MGQKEKNSNEFADFLFNSFVKADRMDDKEKWKIYFILKKYAEIGFPNENQEKQKEYVEKLIRIISNSVPDWRTHLLLLRGDERESDFKIQIGKMEQRYKAFGYDVDAIIDMINDVIKLNNGND